MEKKIGDVQEYLSNIPHINLGGCGIAAITMYRWLEKHNKLDETKFVFMYESDEQELFRNNKRVMVEHKGIPMAPSHCCLFHSGEFIDSKGNANLARFPLCQFVEEEDFIKRAVNNVDDWNTSFNRKKIKEIAEHLNLDLSDIKIK